MKQFNNETIEKAFTLIELLIVISVILLFSGLSLAAYNDFNEAKKLEAETKKFVEVLELAKKKIMSGDKPSTCSLLQSYKVSYGGSVYQLFAQCSSDIQIGSNFNLPTNIIFISSDEIIFKPFGLGTYLGVDGSGNEFLTKSVIIKNNNNSQCRQVTVEASGNINEQKKGC